MRMLDNYKVILWDFDGVILDSMAVRDLGFEKVLSEYPKEQVEALLHYHRANGGLSRYVKFRYFFEQIRNETVSEKQVRELANEFSVIMLNLLAHKELLFKDTLLFIRTYFERFKFHIVSGSDGNELRTLCSRLEIDKYFLSIEGSPTAKNDLVRELLKINKYENDEVCLIGDSKNDLEAAETNHIDFFGYNNTELMEGNYVSNFAKFCI
ncbi:HAD family hydrolase [Sphingobacterium hotanense]|uniref:HAD family hydrolase n=1 Tax=Sphingobacterium hotanense TaxID=649196 RepID=UPI0021A37168|nr:HAD hydrolase-like protein [Sphingobacterium hotanense]MCT1526945.1 HAD hydrolase-like protein [Sphingobacterium hotanense]